MLDADSDKQFNAIINSPFKPGQQVKKIYVEDLTAPVTSNFDALDKNVDPLYLLMKHRPFAKSFQFSTSLYEGDRARNWEYFSTCSRIVVSGIWNQSLHFCCSLAYFKCAQHMQKTLTKLELAKGMLVKRDYYLLRKTTRNQNRQRYT